MNANDKQRLRIEELKRRIREATGEEPVFGAFDDCPPELEQAFLENVLKFELSEERSLFSALEDAGVVLPSPDELDEVQTNLKLWEVINGLADLGVFLHSTDHLSDRELYTYLWCDALVEPVKLAPGDSNYAYHIDLTNSGEEEEEQVFLKYYATEQERLRYAVNFPEVPIPEHCEPPYDRDRLLPDG